MRSIFLLLAGFFLLTSSASAESAGELAILQEFFAQKGVENRSSRLTGAALEQFSRRPMVGEYLPAKAITEFRLLVEDETTAIYEVTVICDGVAQMWSAFFQRGLLASKLADIKALNIPPYLVDIEYKGLLAQKGRSTLQEARLAQLQRLFMTTDTFKKYFNDNRSTFETIARFIESGKNEEAETAVKGASLVGVRLYDTIKSEGEMAIFVGSVAGKGQDQTSSLGSELRVSAFLDSVLGLLHLPVGVSPPPMSAQDFIFVEALADNWYLFRNLAAEPLKEKLEN